MKCVIIIAALASTSFLAFSQTRGRAENSPAMLDMTFPEFGAAAAKTDIAILPIGSIEEHGPKLPLATDSILAVAQLVDVQRYLRAAGIEAIVGPPLNIGITNEAGDWTRDGT